MAKKTEKNNTTQPKEKTMEEKKEQFLTANISKHEEKSKPPIVLLAMLVAVGVLAGAALMITFFTPQITPGTDINNITDVEYRTVPILMLYSTKCKTCRETNTIEELFKVRQIPYSLRKIEASSEDGKELIEKYGVDRVPTAIIDAQKMEFYPTTKNSFDEKTKLINKLFGYYIVPELNLHENYYFPVYFLEKIPGFCSTQKPTIVQFDDYYQPRFTSQREILYGFFRDFNESTEIKFSYIQTQYSWDENSTRANLFLTCASDSKKYPELEHKMTAIYCNTYNGDETMITDSEIQGCPSISSHYGKPLTPIELDIALNRTGVDANTFLTCVDNNRFILNNARKTVEELSILRPSTFLIDCEQTTDLANLKDTFCAIHPKISACSNETDEN